MASSRFDPQPPERDGAADDVPHVGEDVLEEIEAPDNTELLGIIARAEDVSKDYAIRSVNRPLARAYRAWQNQHDEGSKYLGPAFKGRSRLFVPKSRAAVRKNLAAAAGALFSTEDVTSITASHEDDPIQRATAATIKADLEYRLTRSSAKSGMPWFQISMGACLDSQLTGICISKQFWEYEEVETGEMREVREQITNPNTGGFILDANGQPATVVVDHEPVTRVVKDRPMVELHPIENAGIDPAAPWYDPVQRGRWFYMRYPMGLSDAQAMIKSASKRGDHTWLEDISNETLRKGRVEDGRSAARRVREGGSDRYEDGARAGGPLDIIWIQENFVRVDGRDWHFWSVGRHAIISVVREVYEAYPEYAGERPYVMGVAQLDTHRVFPQSPVDTWQPLQLELNDVTNLRLDTLKRSISPLTVAKRGKNVDFQALQRRGQPETVLTVDSMDDVQFVATPGPNGAAYQETSITNANFDELAGVFSTSSVQTSRQLNETVGGMSLMSRAANSVSEFDLRMWVETWVEPVLRQLVHLVRYYESDEKILAVAGKQASIRTRLDYLPTVDDFEACELTVRVNAGIGAADPIQKLQKMKFAFEMLAPIMGEAKAQGITLNAQSIVEEVMGSAGFRDGRRFFEFGDPAPAEPPPEIMLKMKELELKNARLEAEKQKWMGDLQVKMEGIRSGERQSAADNDAAITSSEIEWLGRLAQHGMGQAGNDARQASLLRSKEAESAERYRMLQMGQQKGATSATNNAQRVESNAIPPEIGQVLEQLIRQVGVLSQQVQAQQAMLGGISGRSPNAAPTVQ